MTDLEQARQKFLGKRVIVSPDAVNDFDLTSSPVINFTVVEVDQAYGGCPIALVVASNGSGLDDWAYVGVDDIALAEARVTDWGAGLGDLRLGAMQRERDEARTLVNEMLPSVEALVDMGADTAGSEDDPFDEDRERLLMAEAALARWGEDGDD